MERVMILTSKLTLEEQGSGELGALLQAFGPAAVTELVTDLKPGHTVVPRFRALPFGSFLEREVEAMGCQLINTYRQHRAIADSSHWAHRLDGSDGNEPLTPRQYGLEDLPHLPEGEWFVKGETNSLKNQWLEASYAPTTKDLVRVTGALMRDAWVGTQRVVIKPFQKYRQLATAVNSQPIFHERRAFILDGELLTDAFYWSSWEGELGEIAYQRDKFETALSDTVRRVGHLARFMVVDLAEYPDGSWGVVELNDGSMSGLSLNDPFKLWANFREKVRAED